MKRKSQEIVEEPIFYEDGVDWRIIDLRPDGCDCLPLLARSSFRVARTGVDMHVHSRHIEICYCLKGNVLYDTTEGEFSVLPGRVFISQPGQPHRRCNNPKGMLLYRVLFAVPRKNTGILGLSLKESSALTRCLTQFPFRLCPGSIRVRTAFEHLFELYDTAPRRTIMRTLSMKSAALELLLAIAELPFLPPSPHGRHNTRIKAIVARMEQRPNDDYPVEELAREAALSLVAFTDAFKRETGLPPHAFLLDVRVRRARADLTDSNLSVAAIAHRYQFPSPQHFATVFKQITGYSPRDCRRMSRGDR